MLEKRSRMRVQASVTVPIFNACDVVRVRAQPRNTIIHERAHFRRRKVGGNDMPVPNGENLSLAVAHTSSEAVMSRVVCLVLHDGIPFTSGPSHAPSVRFLSLFTPDALVLLSTSTTIRVRPTPSCAHTHSHSLVRLEGAQGGVQIRHSPPRCDRAEGRVGHDERRCKHKKQKPHVRGFTRH